MSEAAVCGIIGICGLSPISRNDRREVEQGAESLRLRGPDGGGFYQQGGICWGHRRLAILDPEFGDQPWVDPETGVLLVFNGELFNFDELRSQLAARGVNLRTQCDTELLMQAYLVWGRQCLEKISGMFAFALYDPRQEICWLVRDPLGVKPLYYHIKAGRLRFASTLKGLFAFSEVERKLDMAAAMHYLRTVRVTLGRRTMVAGVNSLQPGEQLYWKMDTAAQPQRSIYWEPPAACTAAASTTPSFEDACAETFARVEAAVERQMLSDVPLGGFLSGGLDSSILAHLASKSKGQEFGTFTVGYAAAGFNEWESVRQNADYHQLRNQEIHLSTGDYLNDWQWLIGEKGLPLSTPNEVPICRLAKAFGAHYKVALSGEGADEIFGGYIIPTYCAFDWDRMRSGDGAIDPGCFRKAYGVSDPGSRQAHFFRVNSWLSRGHLAQILDPALLLDAAEDPVEEYYRKLFASSSDESTFSAYLRVHARVNLEGLLSRLDSSTMAGSVEGRVPFTDVKLVEWLFALPDDYKMKLRAGLDAAAIRQRSVYDFDREEQVESKRLLRRAFADCVPPRVLQQRKVSFPVPFTAMFQSEWRDVYQAMLQDTQGPASLLQTGLPKALAATSTVDAMLAWPLVNLFLWQKEFNVEFAS